MLFLGIQLGICCTNFKPQERLLSQRGEISNQVAVQYAGGEEIEIFCLLPG